MWTEAASPGEIRDAADRLRQVFAGMATGARRAIPVELPAQATPARVSRALAETRGAWLDSGQTGRQLIALSMAAEVSWARGRLTARSDVAEAQIELAPFDGLDAVLAALRDGAPARLFGYLAYDLGTAIEDLPALPAADQPLPGFWFGVVESWLEAMPSGEDAYEWTLHTVNPDGAALALALTRLREALTVGPYEADSPLAGGGGDVVSEPDPDGYRAAVRRTVRRIHAGDFFEANICRRLQAPWQGHPRALYDRMREASPGSHGAYLAAADWAVLSVSPETFLEVRDARVETRPIKGTRPRGGDPEVDVQLEAELLDSDKDAAELAMIVDLARNDLGRVCRPGSVEVVRHRTIMRLPTVHHTYSVVAGNLEPDTTVGRLLRASFPPGSITGAPKIEAIRAAAAEEPRRRGVAMGSIGWIDPDGDLELSVAIRTATVTPGLVTYHAGCGIVAESDPDAEFDETVAKAQPFLRAVKGD